MIPTRRSDTAIIQTFRDHAIPAWIRRCLGSVKKWAELHGHDYSLAGNEFYDLCGPEYLARGSKNPQAITNLARLVAARQRLDAGYRQVIWMDADVFVFAPASLVFDFPLESLTTGYAFGREVWLERDPAGALYVSPPRPHNAAAFFTQGAVDLDMLITLIRHIDATRQIVSNFQVGVRLLVDCNIHLCFRHSRTWLCFRRCCFAPWRNATRRRYALRPDFRYRAFAAKLSLSAQEQVTEDVLWRVMDELEAGAGDAINTYATEAGVHLVPYDSRIGNQSAPLALRFAEWRPRLKANLRSLHSGRERRWSSWLILLGSFRQCPLLTVVSTGRRNTLSHSFCWGLILKACAHCRLSTGFSAAVKTPKKHRSVVIHSVFPLRDRECCVDRLNRPPKADIRAAPQSAIGWRWLRLRNVNTEPFSPILCCICYQ